jgi:hypothetical protein
VRDEGSLGLRLSPVAEDTGGAFVEMADPDGLAKRCCPQIAAYDRLIQVGSTPVSTLDFDATIDVIVAEGRPLVMRLVPCREPPPGWATDALDDSSLEGAESDYGGDDEAAGAAGPTAEEEKS